MLPARDGDCIVIKFGEPRVVIVVDIGSNSCLEALDEELGGADQVINLLVVTHVDADHITGAVKLATSTKASRVKDVWFNAHEQLRFAQKAMGIEPFGPTQGELFSRAITKVNWGWNSEFDAGVASLPRDRDTISFEMHGARFSLLSPSLNDLARLEPVWSREIQISGLLNNVEDLTAQPSGFESFGTIGTDVEKLALAREFLDRAPANASSIAFIMEYDGTRILCAGDAHPQRIEDGIRSMINEGEKYRLDLMKISHHGSQLNTTRSLLSVLDCQRFAFSTDGSRHGHPDGETIARILKYCMPGQHKTFFFNYRSSQTAQWDREDLKSCYNYDCVFPTTAVGGVNLSV